MEKRYNQQAITNLRHEWGSHNYYTCLKINTEFEQCTINVGANHIAGWKK